MSKITFDPTIAKAMLTQAEALALFEIHLDKRKKRVHTMERWAFGVMGCDMDLTAVKKAMKATKPDGLLISNTTVGHNVAIWREGKGWLFISTDSTKIEAIKKTRRIKW